MRSVDERSAASLPAVLGRLCASALLLLVACAGPPRERVQVRQGERLSPQPSSSAAVPNSDARECCRPGASSAWRDAVVRTAVGLLGARTVNINGTSVQYDCAGVARAIFLRHGVDLYESRFVSRQANGVRLIHQHVRQFGQLHQGPVVSPGELVFFDNTWDFNGDGQVNDPLTHVGVVETVERDGTVVFLSRVAGAVERYRMNLRQPHRHRADDGRVLNDYLRRKRGGDAAGGAYLTGQLFAGFGALSHR